MRQMKTVICFLLLTFGSVSLCGALETGLQIETEFEEVKVYINGEYKGKTEKSVTGKIYLRIELVPGQYDLRIAYTDYEPAEMKITVEKEGFTRYTHKFVSSDVKSESIAGFEGQQVVQTGIIKIRSIPSGAYVELDGKRMKDVSDCNLLDVPVGQHKVRIYFNNQANLTHILSLAGGQTITVTADFDKGTITDDAEYIININSRPTGSTLYIDGKRIGRVPRQLKLQTGNYTVSVRKEGYEPSSRQISVSSNDYVVLDLEPIGAYLAFANDRDYAPQITVSVVSGRESTRIREPFEKPGIKLMPGEYRIRIEDMIAQRIYQFTHEFEPGHRYVATPILEIPLKQKLYNGENLPGYTEIPDKPRKLNEWKTISKSKFNFGGGVIGVLVGGVVGSFLGGLGGWASFGGSDEGLVIGAVAVGLFYGGVGFFTFGNFIFGDTYTERAKDEEAVAENRKRLAKWEREKRPIEVKNSELLTKANQAIESENKKIDAKNTNRSVVRISDETARSSQLVKLTD